MIEVNNLTKVYNKNKENAFEALHNISFNIEEGEMVAVVGKSGAGKSTILHILAGIENYENGNCVVCGKELKEMKDKEKALYRNLKVGLIMQDFALIDDFTVYENISMPLYFGNQKRKDMNERIECIMNYVGITELSNKKVTKLSGGQKQRVAIARALINSPDIILADEPTGALDSNNGQMIMGLFKKLNQEGKTIIIVTHDMSLAQECKRVMHISDGIISNSKCESDYEK